MSTSLNNLSVLTHRSDHSIQLSHHIHTILMHENYLPVLRGYDLVGFIDGSLTPPTPTILNNNLPAANPAFAR
jgi:hypothetical protein